MMERMKPRRSVMETHDMRSPFLEGVRAAIRVRSYSHAT